MGRIRHRIGRNLLRPLIAAVALQAMAPVRAQELLQEAQRATAAAASDSPEQLACLLTEALTLLRYEIAPGLLRLQEARSLAIRLGDPDREALCLALMARGEAKSKGMPAARVLLKQAEEKLSKNSPASVRGQVDYAFALVHWSFDETADCLSHLNAALEAAEESKDTVLQARCQLQVIGVMGWPDDTTTAIDHIESLGKTAGDPGILLEADLLRAHANVWLGSATDPVGDLRQVMNRAQQLGVRVIEGYAAQVLGAMLARDEPAEAARLANRGVELARQLGDHELLGQGLQRLAEVQMAQGNLAAANQSIDEAVSLLAAMKMPARLHGALETAVRIASSTGDGARAKTFGEQLTKLEVDLGKTTTDTDRARFWQESTRMRTARKQTQERYERELAVVTNRLDRVLWVGAFGLLGIGSLFAILLLRSKRRLEVVNRRLNDEVRTTKQAQGEREALAQNLRQMDRLDSIGLLAGGFAHDFNNILVGVQGNAQALLADASIGGGTREVLAQIAFAGERAAALCKDILTYARQGKSTREIVDLREVIESLLPIARAGFGAGIDVELHLGDVPQLVEVDRAQIEQVLLNVLVNAHDAIGDRGRITIRASIRRLDGTPQSGHWFGEFTGQPRECCAISIADTGHGMTPETIRRIFDPFFSTRFPGRGIGLAATYGILRRHDGVIQISSEPGQGSVFTIYLEQRTRDSSSVQQDEPVVTLEPMPPRPAMPKKGVVLVVDDETTVCKVAQRMLEKEGLTAVVANSGAAGVQEFLRRSSEVTLALIDFTMPDIDGVTLCAELRRQAPELPVIVMSGHDESMVRAAMPDAIFLAKPFGVEALRAAVVQAMGRLV